MEIKVTISLDERTHSILNRLIAALGESKKNATTIVTTVNSAADATDEDEWTEEQKREALEAMYAEENGGTDAVEETPAPAKRRQSPFLTS